MSVQPDTRAAVSSRWIHAALAAFVIASGTCLIAQDQKDRDKKPTPPPPHTNAAPPVNRSERAPSGGQTGARPGNPPATTQTPHSTGTPPTYTPNSHPGGNPPNGAREMHRDGNQPAGNPNVHRDGNQPAYTPNSRPSGNPPTGNPDVNRGGNKPSYTPSSRPGSNPPTYTPQSRPGGTPTPNDRYRPTPSGGTGRPGYTPGRPETTSGPRPVYHGSNGSEVRYRSNGQPQVVRAHGMTITHTPTGVARAEYVRPDRSVIVTQGRHYGYVQRPFVVNNVTYVHRTYVVGGVSYARVYRPYLYHGISLNLYVSSHYYAPAYYGWAYSRWSSPVVFSFGWGPRPWFGFYAGYFAPYPTYAGPAYWLTDYMIATTLQDAYQQQMDAAAGAQINAGYAPVPGGQTGLTPDVKQAIADEVHRQLEQERTESQGGMATQGGPAFLADNASHVFVVSTGLDVQSGSGECSLTEGDVIQMTTPPPANSAMADLAVLASKGQDCRKGTIVSVAVPDLQEMQNHMRATLDQGLSDLQSRQGQGGIPPAPTGANRPPVDAPFLAAAPPPDPNIMSEVDDQATSATRTENDVLDQAQSAAPAVSGSDTQSVTLGMTIDQVVGIMGQPQVKADLGSKKIYSYGNMKIIFQDGKVTDVQ